MGLWNVIDHIKWLITLTSDYIKRLSLYCIVDIFFSGKRRRSWIVPACLSTQKTTMNVPYRAWGNIGSIVDNKQMPEDNLEKQVRRFHQHLRAAFCMQVFFKTFMCLQFEFVIFWWKEIGAKAACEMLVKLTTSLFDMTCQAGYHTHR